MRQKYIFSQNPKPVLNKWKARQMEARKKEAKRAEEQAARLVKRTKRLAAEKLVAETAAKAEVSVHSRYRCRNLDA